MGQPQNVKKFSSGKTFSSEYRFIFPRENGHDTLACATHVLPSGQFSADFANMDDGVCTKQ